MSSLVSIIIPAYNCQRYIAETLESVLNQTFSNFEVIVVDDGSTDHQREVIENFVLKDGRVKCLAQINSGVSAARNNGYLISTGKYVAFLDSDDVWLSNNLELKIQKLESGNFGLVHSDAMLIDEYSQIREGILTGEEGELLDSLLLWNSTQVPGPSSILVRREVIEEIGLFDINLSTAADKEFFIRIAAKHSFGRVGHITWKYRIHSQNMHNNLPLMERDVLYMYEKASRMNLFRDKRFERKCYSNMYMILAKSWIGDGKNLKKGFYFLIKSIGSNPVTFIQTLHQIKRKLFGAL
jgi:glycosyltransferase involved in cell wall biosynthesis